MKVLLLIIGDELTRGKKADGNGPWLAAALDGLGHDVLGIRVLPDRPELLEPALERAARDVGDGWVIATGGLGPTEDDRTKATVARLTGRPLRHDEAVWQAVQARFARLERTPTASNRSQALVPEGATVLPNPVGTAPGLLVPHGTATLCLLPGVPHEMTRIWTDSLRPLFADGAQGGAPVSIVLRTTGIPESELADRLGGLPEAEGLAYLPSAEGVELHVTVRAADATAARAEAERRAAVLAELCGDGLWGRDDETLAAVVGRLLLERKLRVCTAESCTAGLVAGRLTEVPGSSAWVDRGFVTYTNEAKEELLGVPTALLHTHGAVSAPVAAAMARGALARSRSEIAVALTGIAGPGGGSPEKPVGLVFVAVADGRGCVVQRWVFGSERRHNRERSVQAALELLRRRLLDLPLPGTIVGEERGPQP